MNDVSGIQSNLKALFVEFCWYVYTCKYSEYAYVCYVWCNPGNRCSSNSRCFGFPFATAILFTVHMPTLSSKKHFYSQPKEITHWSTKITDLPFIVAALPWRCLWFWYSSTHHLGGQGVGVGGLHPVENIRQPIEKNVYVCMYVYIYIYVYNCIYIYLIYERQLSSYSNHLPFQGWSAIQERFTVQFQKTKLAMERWNSSAKLLHWNACTAKLFERDGDYQPFQEYNQIPVTRWKQLHNFRI